ncbi:hypothetical protein GCM10027169_16060 [Gordonia jinhuaensis]|uniref:Uncharacterized protein n=1 Tax=Gordonia jinhuaensis TaxID=1517702 RepID=A0A916X1S2_9ACTN|nr:hypothetical protein GCM10011489_39710 [Gordonia jinhuaensis]
MPELLIDAAPTGFEPTAYGISAAPATRTLADGDEIDLGDRVLRVLHLPVHVVYPGHGDPFDGERMRVLIDEYTFGSAQSKSEPMLISVMKPGLLVLLGNWCIETVEEVHSRLDVGQ